MAGEHSSEGEHERTPCVKTQPASRPRATWRVLSLLLTSFVPRLRPCPLRASARLAELHTPPTSSIAEISANYKTTLTAWSVLLEPVVTKVRRLAQAVRHLANPLVSSGLPDPNRGPHARQPRPNFVQAASSPAKAGRGCARPAALPHE
ncbi:uncharacterized protein B0H18DRAFT_47899 [Fomitopsis serialis]|uniref:uncharacterized protein n=1 Tax=Fomitopsis serialis TaxID=139415 RepID=UPI0020088397|nr:uncharacterized protein B0H18DRAFT_539777 [Neoantrodia serialis]XP_047887985.1 uncharacterized protein B0H18DRAFT_47899 [Neoantrodia serialis]KAH9908825.1 hypothetical protein B0H18DRAFT_539777 [Neoantrodia serialis]KAH9916898.1 hypothetical protein B0H18DRAFT_47899 [Neoantrodia serialis]